MPEPPPRIGDHVALDLLNTVLLVKGELVDTLKSDQDVLEWLKRGGQPVLPGDRKGLPPGALVSAARKLREIVREAVLKRKAGGQVNVRALNNFLAQGASHVSLALRKDGSVRISREWKQDSPEQLLSPLAEAAADLLAHGDFDLIRKCGSDDCVLWFYDRTKSHHRKWCSVSTCGNRSKVAAFRQRRSAAAKK
jgi:predicted RNA-binding Zn ribbon-like protein